jgi:protein O-GlcNAc transferase
MPTTADLFAQALSLHQAGNLSQAATLYGQIPQDDARHAEAVHFLGVIAHQQGDHARALELIQRSLALAPLNAGFQMNYGAVLVFLGRCDEALACYREAVQLQPQSAHIHCRLGRMLEMRGELSLAIASYRDAVRVQPDSAEAHFSLGNALLVRGDPAEAVECYQDTLQLQPKHAEAHSNLGVALFDLGRIAEAAASYERALQAQPIYPEALNNLGNALRELGRLDDAIACYKQAVHERPDFADAYGNLANALTLSGELPEALASYRRTLELRPDLSRVRSNYLLCLNYDPHADGTLLLEEHRRWGELHGRSPPNLPQHRNDRDPLRVLRVGYLAHNFRATAFSCFLQPVLHAHDASQVQLVCYQLDPVRNDDGLAPAADDWRALRGRTPAQIADLVRADGIDILVDLLGHTRGHSLEVFPHRPAPIQITWLGYPNTTGLTCIDYRLTDAVADPPGEAICHVEDLIRLPSVFCCYGPPQDAPPIGPLPMLRNGWLTFGSHHNLAKLNPAVLDLWCRVLGTISGSRLIVFRDTLHGSVAARLLAQFSLRGIDARRIDLRSTSAIDQAYLAMYHEVDVMLDAFPWSGHTTTCDALWMGVPVLTLRGHRHAARMAASMLSCVGLPELIAQDGDDFLRRALRIGQDIDRLVELRAGLRERMAAAPLCNAKRFTRDLENTYRAMWQRWCASA